MIAPAMSGRPGRLLSVIEVITFREKKMSRPLVAHGRAVKNLTILADARVALGLCSCAPPFCCSYHAKAQLWLASASPSESMSVSKSES